MGQQLPLGRQLLQVLACLCLFFAATCLASPTLVVGQDGPHPKGVALTPYFEVLEDPSQTMTLADVQASNSARLFKGDLGNDSSVKLGYSQSAFWLRLKLANPGDKPLPRLIEIANPTFGFVDFYHPDAAGQYRAEHTGIQAPFESRPYLHRHFVFPLTLQAHSEQLVYLRVHSITPISVLGKLWTPETFRAVERNDYIGQAWYFGIVTAMAVFNLLMFVTLREAIYLRYVAFILVMALTLATQSGLVKEFLLHDAPWWSSVGAVLGFCFTLVFALGFMRHMLNTAKTAPQLDKVARVLTGVLMLAALWASWDIRVVIEPATLFFAAVALFILGTGIVCALKRQRSAYFFVAAFAIVCLAGVLAAARSLGLVSPSFLTENALRIGSGIEMLLLAFALADRFNVIRIEKNMARREADRIQRRLVDTLKTSERVLEQRVAERTAELDQKNAELSHAIASREDVERIARHDIKTPLGSLTAAPALLRAGRTMSAQEETILTMVEKAAGRALDMVNLSLDLYQMENGSYVFKPDTVNLTELVRSVVQDLSVHAQSKAVTIQISGHEPTVYVQGNDSLCYSILANLTKNAIEAAPEHTAVDIALLDGPQVVLRIHNTGEVPAAIKSRFFAKYGSKGKAGGTGLGAYSAQLLARVQGGSLTMQSTQEAGTTLALTLAQAQPPLATSATSAHASDTAPAKAQPAPQVAALHVLVVDDDEFNLMVVESHLPQPPLLVTTAVNGRLAVQAVIHSRPDVVILDVEMPVMGGLEALARIRAYQADQGQAPSFVVAYSGSDDPLSIEKFRAAGFDHCLKKPSSRESVLAVLELAAALPH
jgi:signal transduction histidine kinase/ActR/RegA family two-component response regulator